MTYVLQDRTSGSLELLPRRAFLSEGVAQLVVLEDHTVSFEAFLGASLLSNPTSEGTWALRLNATHHLQLGTTARPPVTEDGQHFAAAAPFSFVAVLVHEEHEDSPLFFHGTQCRTAVSSNVPDAITWNIDHSAVVPFLPPVDVNWAFQLVEKPLHVFLRSPTLRLLTREESDMSHVLHDGLGRALKLLARTALLPESIGQLVVLEGHRVRSPRSAGVFP
mmetsp:Transcript_29554/g.78191  ORF Transcript_29554/g.78191 Transcript_29554/m.78191 type:complete len:220 (-) Transcript_29554:743-1402(-)